MIKLGLLWTGYLIISFAVFLLTSFTIIGGIAYIFLLLPFYGLLLFFGWLKIIQNKNKTPHFKELIWIVVFILQISVIATAPGNCYLAKQGESCYSNLQIMAGKAPSYGASDVPHWTIIENAFFGMLPAYAIALSLGVGTTSFKANQNKNPSDDEVNS